ncbi:MAG: SDR family NAD(P)-dependent oxidoreductase [Ignavibacteriaceae bacterium]
MSKKDLSIVTGASRGIGYGIALKLAEENHDVMIFGRDVDALQKVQKEIKSKGVECDYFSGDVNDIEFVNKSVKKIEEKFGKVDHLINNAGVGILKPFVDSTLDEFKKQVDTNLYGVYNFTKAVINGMIERKSGSIINIASLAGKNSFIGGTMYSATKHALLGFTRSLMLEVREYNIRVASICPGSVYTEFGDRMMAKKKDKILQIEDVAHAVAAIINLPVSALMSEIDLRPTNPK